MKKYKGYIFDFDYTLGDSTNGIVICINNALERLEYEILTRTDIVKTIGMSLEKTFEVLTNNNDIDKAQLFKKYFKEKALQVMVENTVIYPDALKLISKLNKTDCQIAIVSTKFHHVLEQIIIKYELSDYIKIIIGSDDVTLTKPNPEGIVKAIDKMKLSKSDILYIGDNIIDAQAAENAEVDYTCVLTGTNDRKDFAPYSPIYIGDDLSALLD